VPLHVITRDDDTVVQSWTATFAPESFAASTSGEYASTKWKWTIPGRSRRSQDHS